MEVNGGACFYAHSNPAVGCLRYVLKVRQRCSRYAPGASRIKATLGGKEIELTVSDALMDFLNRMSEKTGMNHSDLICWLIAWWMRDQTERDVRREKVRATGG